MPLSLSPDERLLVSQLSAKLLNHIKYAGNTKATAADSTEETRCTHGPKTNVTEAFKKKLKKVLMGCYFD